MNNVLKSKKFYIILFSVVLGLAFLSLVGYCFYNKTLLKNEIASFEDYYLKNYSRKKFVKTALRDMEPYNKNILRKYIINNFDLFLSTNSNLSLSIFQYAKLYEQSFNLLSSLKKSKAIYSKDFKEINNYLNNFQFNEIINKLYYITLKNNSNDILAKKKYFEGIIYELNFNYDSAKNAYLQSTKLNLYEPKYYNRLGGIYYKLYDFDSAIDVLLNGLNISNFTSKINKNVKLDLLFNLAKTYGTIRNNEKAIATYTNLLVNSINMNNSDYEWLAVYNLSLIEANLGNYDVSIDYSKYALKIATKMRNKEYIAKSLNILSNIQYKYGDYENGKTNGLKAIKFAKKISNLNLIADASLNVCLNYDYLYKPNLAKIYCDRALKINNIAGRTINRPEYYLQNGFIYSFVSTFRDYEQSLHNYSIAYNISRNYNLLLLESIALSGMADANNMLNKKDLALKNLKASVEIDKKLNIAERISANINFGQIYWSKNESENAIAYYKTAIFLGLKSDNNLVISTAGSHLAILYDELKNYSEALKYSTLALDANMKTYRFDHHYIKYQEGWQEKILKNLNNKKGK